MWKQKIGISVYNNYTVPNSEVVHMVKRIGFDAVSFEWDEGVDLHPAVEAAKECGLELQSLHAPIGRARDMWSEDEAVSSLAKSDLITSLDDCVEFEIPILVVHVWIGFEYRFDADSLCFRNFDEIVAYAKAHNIQIAFENTEGEEFLAALMEHYKDEPMVGFCWDSGHEMCYNHSQDILGKFADKLIVTHLNDNLGISRFDGNIFWTDDLHLLPYDGIGDWDDNIARLRKARHLDILNFELNINSKPDRHENDIYGQMGYELYFTEAFKRACRIASRYAD